MAIYNGEYQTTRLFNYFKAHPGLLISASYLLLTSCGLMFSYVFYSEFDVAILKLISMSDLLIIGISEPFSLLLFFGSAAIAMGIDWISYRSFNLRKKYQAAPKSIKRTLILALLYTPKKSEHMVFLLSLVFAVYFFVSISWFAESKSEAIKNGQGDKIIVQSGTLKKGTQEVILLGTTTHFLVSYDNNTKTVLLLPVENINKINSIQRPEQLKKETTIKTQK